MFPSAKDYTETHQPVSRVGPITSIGFGDGHQAHSIDFRAFVDLRYPLHSRLVRVLDRKLPRGEDAELPLANCSPPMTQLVASHSG